MLGTFFSIVLGSLSLLRGVLSRGDVGVPPVADVATAAAALSGGTSVSSLGGEPEATTKVGTAGDFRWGSGLYGGHLENRTPSNGKM